MRILIGSLVTALVTFVAINLMAAISILATTP